MNDYNEKCMRFYGEISILDRDNLSPAERAAFDHGAEVYKARFNAAKKE